LHLLAVAHGVRKPHRKDTLECVLQAPDRNAMLHWLRHQRMAILETSGKNKLLMVHAGVLPAWTATKTIAYAKEVERLLQSADVGDFLTVMYGNAPERWSESLRELDRIRVIVNVLTRLRFCTTDGTMEFETKDSAQAAPEGYLPWFEVPGRKTAKVTVAFGHWSTLGWLGRTDVLAMDTGCVWGGCLSALRVEAGNADTAWNTELIQVQCVQAQKPGRGA
jgi:bis(5'-nucleosyl)-tetraphosphatase (symmetrical)